jgi:catalase
MSESPAAGGALGYFEVTGDAARFCRAGFLAEIGQRTPAQVRFTSPGRGRGVRGFAVRLATQEGEHEIAATHVPVAGTRTGNAPQRRFAPSAEAAHQLALLMSDRGIPPSWRHMNGYASRRAMWISATGEFFWARYHFKTEQDTEPASAPAHDPGTDLKAALSRGETPSWRFDVQLMPRADTADCGFDPFDLTKVWPHADYPPRSLGRLVLERDASVQPLSPRPLGRVLPGIGPAPTGPARHVRASDDSLQVRRFWRDVLTDDGRHRLVSSLAHEHPASPAYWVAVDPELGIRVAIAVEALARVS